MSDVMISQRWLARGGTSADLAAVNETPKSRELILETDTGRLKRGDGATAYNDLPYINTGKIDFSGIADGKVPMWSASSSRFELKSITADAVEYTAGSSSSLEADNVAEALDELSAKVGEKIGDAPSDGNTYGRKNGAWALAGGGSGGGYPEGTSNPVSPSLNDKFYRTDLNLLIYYDGTRWLTVNEYALPGIQEATLSVSANGIITRYPMQSARQIYITRWVVTTRVASGNNGSNYWTGALESQTAAASTSTIASVSTVSDASGDWVQHETVVDAVIRSTEVVLRTNATKTGSPGGFYLVDAIYFRQVVE